MKTTTIAAALALFSSLATATTSTPPSQSSSSTSSAGSAAKAEADSRASGVGVGYGGRASGGSSDASASANGGAGGTSNSSAAGGSGGSLSSWDTSRMYVMPAPVSAAILPPGLCPKGDSLSWSIGWNFFSYASSSTRSELACLEKVAEILRANPAPPPPRLPTPQGYLSPGDPAIVAPATEIRPARAVPARKGPAKKAAGAAAAPDRCVSACRAGADKRT